MKPKDLLEHLEKGNRTLHFLTKTRETGSIAQQVSTLNDAFYRAYSGSINQLGQTYTGTFPNQGMAVNSNVLVQGGILRW